MNCDLNLSFCRFFSAAHSLARWSAPVTSMRDANPFIPASSHLLFFNDISTRKTDRGPPGCSIALVHKLSEENLRWHSSTSGCVWWSTQQKNTPIQVTPQSFPSCCQTAKEPFQFGLEAVNTGLTTRLTFSWSSFLLWLVLSAFCLTVLLRCVLLVC